MYRRLLLPSTCRNHIVVVFIYLTHFFSTMSSKFITVVPQSNCGNAQASQLLGEYDLPMSFGVESSFSTKHIFKTISIKWRLKIQIIFGAGMRAQSENFFPHKREDLSLFPDPRKKSNVLHFWSSLLGMLENLWDSLVSLHGEGLYH